LVKGNKQKHNLLLGYVMVIVIIFTEVCCLISEFKQSKAANGLFVPENGDSQLH